MSIQVVYNHIDNTWSYRDNQGEHPIDDPDRMAEIIGVPKTSTMVAYGNEPDRWIFTLTW